MIHHLFISNTFCESSSLQQVASSKHHATIWKKNCTSKFGAFRVSERGPETQQCPVFFVHFGSEKLVALIFGWLVCCIFFFEWEVTLGMILFVAFFAFCWMVSDWPAICDVHREILLNFFNRDRDGKSLWLLQIGFSLCFLQDSAPCCTLRIRGSNGSFFFTIAGVLWGGPQTSHFWKGQDSEGISKWT